MPSFKKLLQNSWHFYKAHWKPLVLLLLPIEALILIFALALRFGLTPPRFYWVGIMAFIFALALLALKILKKVIIFSGGFIAHDLEHGERASIEARYKSIWQKIWPIVEVGALQCLYAFVAVLISFVAALAVLALPFLLMNLVARINPDTLAFFAFHGGGIFFYSFIVASLFFAVLSTLLISSVWFSSYALLLDGRKGLDALATSALIVRGRRKQILWRLIVIGLISLLPIIIILGPIYWMIVAETLPKLLWGLVLYMQFNIVPVFPNISDTLFIWRAVLTSLACLVAAPVFITLNYFLWKDVRHTGEQFEEKTYTKTRKRIKVWVWIGTVLLTLGVVGSLI